MKDSNGLEMVECKRFIMLTMYETENINTGLLILLLKHAIWKIISKSYRNFSTIIGPSCPSVTFSEKQTSK